MRIEIFSLNAAVMGGTVDGEFRRTTWADDVPGLDTSGGVDDTNERIFRFFNRVTEADANLLDRMGYYLPSLSVGDFVTWGGNTYQVASVGFVRVTENGDYLLRSYVPGKAG